MYEPQEDSKLLKSVVDRLAKGKVLDMGTGSGILAVTAANKKGVREVIGVDIDKKSITYCKKKYKKIKIKWKVSDLFSKLGGYKKYFDLIIFNPPYLPQEGRKRHIDLEGGKKGYEVIAKFLETVNEYLKDDGIVLLLFSSKTKEKKVLEIIEQRLFDYKLEAKEKLFFEEIYVYKISKKEILKKLEKKEISNVQFFARGKRGNVYTGEFKNKKVAIKIKRKESTALNTIEKEAKWLKFFNLKKIGPKYLFHSKDFLVYQFIEGEYFKNFIHGKSSNVIKKYLRELLTQCYVMDKVNVDKKEMTRPLKNAIVSHGKIVLIDFDHCHKVKSPQNVTQLCDFILKISKNKHIRFTVKLKGFMRAVKEYAHDKSKKNYEKIVKLVK